MDAIRLHNIALFAHHGITPQEQQLGQRFYLDIELGIDLSAAAQQDDLALSIDYDAVYHTVATAFSTPTCKLLERAAWQVIEALLARFPAREIRVRVRKAFATANGLLDAVEVELCRRREEVLSG